MGEVAVAKRPGAFVLVVGPSGAGKDTVIEFARQHLRDDPRYVFARRTITRTARDEDHETMTAEQFAAALQSGGFALSWQSHGLSYGIPANVAEAAHSGRIVIINASRAVIADALRFAPRVVVAHITASPAVLAARLAARGRESAADIEQRLARDVPIQQTSAEIIRIENEGDAGIAGRGFVTLLERVAASQAG